MDKTKYPYFPTKFSSLSCLLEKPSFAHKMHFKLKKQVHSSIRVFQECRQPYPTLEYDRHL